MRLETIISHLRELSCMILAYTKEENEMISFMKWKLNTSDNWALRALERIYSSQTKNEKIYKETRLSNGVGFTGRDARFLSSLLESFKTYGHLTSAQMEALKRIMPKYAGQIFKAPYTDKEKLRQLFDNQKEEFYKSKDNSDSRQLELDLF